MNSFLKTTLATIMVVSIGMMVFYVYEPKVAEAGWYATGGTWSYRKVITINNSKVEGTSNLTNFPILVDLTDSNLATYAQADGDDILFTSGDGTTKLDHEIEVYTNTTGRLTAWVEVPTLDYDDNTVIYMYFGNASASSQQNATGVWDSNYLGVWHLKDGSSLTLTDSTANAETLTNVNSATAIAGKIDGAVDLSGSLQYLTRASGSWNTQPAAMTISAWVKNDSFDNDYNAVISSSQNPGGNVYFDLHIKSTGKLACYARASADVSYDGTGTNTLSTATWYHLSMTYDSTNGLTCYVNGEFDGTAAANGTLNSGTVLLDIGNNQAFSPRDINGIIDEPRVSNTVRSADWIKTEYNNQSATSTFYTISSAQTAEPEDVKIRGGGSATNSNVKIRGGLGWYNQSWSYRKPITINKSKVINSDLTDFPVLIDLTDSNLASSAQADGDDILFTLGDGTTKLAHEIELYTNSTGRLTAWVKIPTLYAERDTTIYMYYGNSGASSQQNATGVWDSNYKGVYHLPDGTTLTANDSTSNANNGTLNNSPTATTGKIDGAVDFAGASSQYINGTGINIASTPFTISFWVKMDGGGGDQTIFSIGSTGAQRQAIHFRRTSDTSITFGMWLDDLSSSVPNLTSWRYITATLDSSFGQRLYADGTLQNSRTAGGYFTGNTTWNIGRFQSFGEYISGNVDEVRVSAVSRSADWIATEYNNQSATSTFYNIGSQETNGNAATRGGVKFR